MTLVDESYLTSCPRCGSVVLRPDQATHDLFHQAIVDLATVTEQINQGLDASARVSHELWNAVQALTAQVVDLRRRIEPPHTPRYEFGVPDRGV